MKELTIGGIVNFVFGEISDERMETIIFGCTGYLSFWRTDYPMKEFYYQLKHAKRSLKKGYSVDRIYCGADVEHKPTVDKVRRFFKE